MLRLKRIAIDTYHENVAYLGRDCTDYRAESFQALSKIEITPNHDHRRRKGGTGKAKKIFAVLNIIDDDRLLGPEELGLSEQAFDLLGLDEGHEVDIAQATPPASLDGVRDKIRGETLTSDEIHAIIGDIAAKRYSKMEIAAFLISSASFLSTAEVLSLTRAMAGVGTRLEWDLPVVVDKHCVGGVPGNRTSMIVVPIVAAYGLTIPKTSSRAITSPAGTADTMEVMAKVALSFDEMRDIVNREKGCLVWGGHVDLSPADDILISVERPLGIDTREQMVASILSKKMAAGSTHLVIDIPIGPSAKVRSHDEAIRLRKLFEFIGDEIGLNLKVVITDGAQPIGRGIGPVLEAREVMKVLRCDPDGPVDLREKSLLLAGHILEFDPGLRGGQGFERARAILESGEALTAMNRILDAQGRVEQETPLGELTVEILADGDGYVTAIDCYRLARIARLAGAPMDKGAGIELIAKIGDKVERGGPLYRVYATAPTEFRYACDMACEDNGYGIGERPPPAGWPDRAK